MERGVWGERSKKSFHFKYKILFVCIRLQEYITIRNINKWE
jgi:hypothetical protein